MKSACAVLGLGLLALLVAIGFYLWWRRRSPVASLEQKATQLRDAIIAQIACGPANFSQHSTVSCRIENFYCLQTWLPRFYKRIVVCFSFTGTRNDFETLVENYVRVAIVRFQRTESRELVCLEPTLIISVAQPAVVPPEDHPTTTTTKSQPGAEAKGSKQIALVVPPASSSNKSMTTTADSTDEKVWIFIPVEGKLAPMEARVSPELAELWKPFYRRTNQPRSQEEIAQRNRIAKMVEDETHIKPFFLSTAA